MRRSDPSRRRATSSRTASASRSAACASARPEGHIHDFGVRGPEAELQLNDWAAVTALLARGDIGFGEGYVAGLWDTPAIEPLVDARPAERGADAHAMPSRAAGTASPSAPSTTSSAATRRAGSRRNIRAHYDVGNEFYGEWLDPSFTYSSALFAEGDDLARAQDRKYDRILERLGDRAQVLEIGCGWGGFAERAAGRGHAVTAVTISPSQKAFADARLDGRADVRLCDYRATAGSYQAIVSIEMIEAVGERYWPTYFATLKQRLAEGGRAVIQAITVSDEDFPRYRRGTDYIRHSTFPGGMLLCNRAINEQATAAGLRADTSFAFGHDYATTCRIWAARLVARHERVAALGYGGPTFRHWRYYLEACAACFAVGRTDVVQVELSHG